MEEIDFKELLKYYWSKKIIIIIITIVFGIISAVYNNFFVIPKYKAVTSIILTKSSFETEAEVEAYSKMVERYSVLADSYTVAQKVIEKLELNITIDELKKCIKIEQYPTGYSLCVEVIYQDSNMAVKIADEIAKSIIDEIYNVYNDENVKILDYAVENAIPINNNSLKNTIKFCLVGIIFVTGILLIKYLFFIEHINIK